MNLPAVRTRVKDVIRWQVRTGFGYAYLLPGRHSGDSGYDMSNQNLEEGRRSLSPNLVSIVCSKHAVRDGVGCPRRIFGRGSAKSVPKTPPEVVERRRHSGCRERC